MVCRLTIPTEDKVTSEPRSRNNSNVRKMALAGDLAAPPLEGRLGAGPAVMRLTGFPRRWPLGAADSDGLHGCAQPADPGLSPRCCERHRDRAPSRRSVAMAVAV
jgi:hypothetical protein